MIDRQEPGASEWPRLPKSRGRAILGCFQRDVPSDVSQQRGRCLGLTRLAAKLLTKDEARGERWRRRSQRGSATAARPGRARVRAHMDHRV
jgi:hypothetical protein